MGKIKYLVMDVDGTLTDGKIYMGHQGELFKAFDIKDGCGISLILPQHNITPIIITARESEIVNKRCIELNIIECYQGVKDKLKKLCEVVEDDLASVAYIGDDLTDIACMNAVNDASGITGCPFDAAQEVKSISNYISPYAGGRGAVRDFIEWIAGI